MKSASRLELFCVLVVGFVPPARHHHVACTHAPCLIPTPYKSLGSHWGTPGVLKIHWYPYPYFVGSPNGGRGPMGSRID